MAHTIQFEQFQPGEHPECQACEAMLTDALDEVLSPADQAWFDAHIALCAGCSARLADARRGAAWLEILKYPRPEPSAGLLERILAQTDSLSGSSDSPLAADVLVAAPGPSELPRQPFLAPILPFRPRTPIYASWMPSFSRTSFEPRLAMTAAMAFFSIALTLNLTGVRLDRLNVAELNADSLKHTFYQVKGDAARRYDSLRVVHVLESRVEDLKAASAENDPEPTPPADRTQPDSNAPAQPQATPAQPQTNPPAEKREQKGPGVSHFEAPRTQPRLLPVSRRFTGSVSQTMSMMQEKRGLA